MVKTDSMQLRDITFLRVTGNYLRSNLSFLCQTVLAFAQNPIKL